MLIGPSHIYHLSKVHNFFFLFSFFFFLRINTLFIYLFESQVYVLKYIILQKHLHPQTYLLYAINIIPNYASFFLFVILFHFLNPFWV